MGYFRLWHPRRREHIRRAKMLQLHSPIPKLQNCLYSFRQSRSLSGTVRLVLFLKGSANSLSVPIAVSGKVGISGDTFDGA